MRTQVRRLPRASIAIAAIVIVIGGCTAAIGIEALARAHLSEGTLATPTRFYARPVVLRPGSEMSTTQIEEYLDRLGYRRTNSRHVDIGEYYLSSWRWVIGRRAFRHFDQLYPGGVTTVRLDWGREIYSVRDSDGTDLPYLVLEPELIRSVHGDTREDRIPVPLADVPEFLVAAVLAMEDRRFFDHPGIDVTRVFGAAAANVKARRVVQGASTLTQQFAKNAFLISRRSVVRKLREATMSLVLEWRHSKEEILEAYLNQVYLGQDGGLAIHGVGRAAQFYFGKDVSQLDLSEAALLAGIIRGPSLYSPFRHPERATDRRDLVLRLMYESDLISQDTYRDALDTRITLRDRPERTRSGRYFTDYVADQLRTEFGEDVLERGLAVFTTLDLELQRFAEDAVRDGLVRLESRYSQVRSENSQLQAALVAINPRTGEILAMVGGRDYGTSQFNRAVHARRQPGSAFKPIVAATALTAPRDGDEWQEPPFTLSSVLDDEPLEVETPVGIWQPVNFDGRFRGQLTLRDALERSLNVPFARLGLAVGPERIVETARALGIESPLAPYPSLALGAFEVTPLELTRAFGVFAAEGFRAESHSTLSVVDRSGELLSRAELHGDQPFSDAESYLVTSALVGAVQRGTGRGLSNFGFHGEVAAKSGTTNDFRDGWFVGYTPNLAIGVWVGFDDGEGMELTGSRAALPIFAQFLVEAVGAEGDGRFEMPWDVEVVEVDPETGLRAGPGCWGEREVFLRGTAPEQSCSPYWSPARRSRSSFRFSSEVGRLIGELRRLLDGDRTRD